MAESNNTEDSKPAEEAQNTAGAAQKKQQLDRLNALRRRKTESAQSNRKEVHKEYASSKINNPKLISKLERQKAEAEFELAKLEDKQNGVDFERRRAWDWTVEESEKWDERVALKKQTKDTAHFSDFASAAERAYLKEIRELKDPDLAAYQREKLATLKKNATLIEGADGETIVYDASSSNGSGGASLDSLHSKPSKEAVDRLVGKLKQDDVKRMKRRRRDDAEDEHVTYINEKNKQFNRKLSRHYDKYTKEIRDSFERGTAL